MTVADAVMDPVAAWSRALAQFESEVGTLEAALVDDLTLIVAAEAWQAPTLSGPIPTALLPRARAVAARQEAAQQALTAAMGDVREQRDLVRKVDTRTSVPIYLDVRA